MVTLEAPDPPQRVSVDKEEGSRVGSPRGPYSWLRAADYLSKSQTGAPRPAPLWGPRVVGTSAGQHVGWGPPLGRVPPGAPSAAGYSMVRRCWTCPGLPQGQTGPQAAHLSQPTSQGSLPSSWPYTAPLCAQGAPSVASLLCLHPTGGLSAASDSPPLPRSKPKPHGDGGQRWASSRGRGHEGAEIPASVTR